MNYLHEVEALLEVYPNVEVRAVDGLDFALDKPTITYLVDVAGVELQFLTYADTEYSAGELEDFLESIEAMVNVVS